MTREIKFRAWDGKRIFVPAIHHSGYDLNELLYSFDSDGVKLMQYTGLKDKNGTEIFEGDVVKCHIFVQELGENYGVTEGEREFVGEVKFGVTGFNVEANGFSDNPVFYESFHEESLEVIGNIYETPELLKAIERI